MTKYFVRTLIAQTGCDADQLLTFEAGEILEVSCIADIGWWKGTILRTKAIGYFDQTNVEIVDDKEASLIVEQLQQQQQQQQQQQDEKARKLEHRRSLLTIIAAIDVELDLLRDACDDLPSRQRSHSDRVVSTRVLPKKPTESLPPLPLPSPKASSTTSSPLTLTSSSPPSTPSSTATFSSSSLASPTSPMAPAPPPKSLKPALSVDVACSSGEASPTGSPDSSIEELFAPRPKRSVTFSENLVTVFEEERIQERKEYLSERKRALTATLSGLEADKNITGLGSRRDERLRKTGSFLCEERILPNLLEEEEGDGLRFGLGKEKKKKVWPWMNRKKQQQQQPVSPPPVLMMSH